tara:strand:- start:6041 stop:6964 length:924 start_codon:yes stop_codon:yes gene_type:complete
MPTRTKDLVEIYNNVITIKNSILNSNSDNFPIDEQALIWLLRQARVAFMNDDMLVNICPPVTICGDIHGQFPDLKKIFSKKGYPSQKCRYLFLGDYVDRGRQSLEVIVLLFCYKILFHNDIILLRGNHETSEISKVYGFYDECKRRVSIKAWKSFIEVFNRMPIAATIGNHKDSPTIFCCHGGISPSLYNIFEINNISRPTDVPDRGIVCDLLWSDPNVENDSQGWIPSDRGVSYLFSKNELNKFLRINNLELVVRAHQVVEDGYEFFANRKLVTIFSAPNYCGEFDNKGGIMTVNTNYKCSFDFIS